jgi:hypothetical protein
LEESFRRFGRNGKDFVFNAYANALLALPQAKRAAKLDFILQAIFLDQAIERFHDLARAFDMARTTDTNGDFHKTDFLPFDFLR